MEEEEVLPGTYINNVDYEAWGQAGRDTELGHYQYLQNKPKINGVEFSNDRLASEYGLSTIAYLQYYTAKKINEYLEARENG